MNPLLYGHARDERIVAVHLKEDRAMRVYFREPTGVRHEDVEFFPFFFLTDKQFLEGFSKKHWMKKLEGNLDYQYLCAFEEWPAMWEAIRLILERFNRTVLRKVETYAELDIIHLYANPATQYLLQSGRTLFKGMRFEEIHRLQLDIETYSSPPYRFSNPGRPSDRIILIALSDNRGWKHLIDGKKLDEKEMLLELVRIIMERDPDVIEGHNIYAFDLPYILRRCELNDVVFGIGRDGSVPGSLEMRTSFAERSFEYTVPKIAGRHTVDTLLLVQSYDMTKRNMESHGLKYAARYFGLSSPDRTYVPADRISWHWDHDPAPLMAYALDDVEETGRLSEHLSGSAFYLSQMLPISYGQVVRMGSAGKIESLMVREYLRQRHSIPKPKEGVQARGGYTGIFLTGILGPIVHADVESLYPSIMLTHGISPATDVRMVFLDLLRELTSMRLEAKRNMGKAKDPTERSRLDALQSSFKILINSFYGYLGYARGLFNDYTQADRVTQIGQKLLRETIGNITAAGGRVLEADTDGIFFVPPDNSKGESAECAFVEELSARMPKGIILTLDGRYRRMLSYKKKNYALLAYEGDVIIKGSSLISRSMERFGRHYIRQCIECLLKNDIKGLHELYTSYHRRILERAMDIKDLCRTETLKATPGQYAREIEAGNRNRSAAYEVAIASGRTFKAGDRVTYYVTGNDTNPRSFENCKPVEGWDPNFPDENLPFYLRRLDEFSEKFKDFFLPQDFRTIFSADDLFPFDSAGITLVTGTVSDESQATPAEGKAEEPGTWLDE